jgi:glycine cleavage system H protein
MVPQSSNPTRINELPATAAGTAAGAVENIDIAPVVPVNSGATTTTPNYKQHQKIAARAARFDACGTNLGLVKERTNKTQGGSIMTVLIILLMFSIFMTLDYVYSRRRAEQPVLADQPEAIPLPHASEPVWVGGYQLPEDIRYHLGHTWVRPLSGDTVVVGIDDFARRLVGKADQVALPEAGARLTAGRAAFRVTTHTGDADLVAPLSGEVLEVNPRLGTQPGLVSDEPYGRGWLVKMKSHDLASALRNLMDGSLARRWTEDARGRLDMQLVALSGSVLQDGGEPVADFAAHLPEEDWKRLVREFLLT